ncbi:WGR domain-containing protein [Maritimibacter sp. DP07]|uniref:WGR domain-containing protein n=1 Tax=Maritimibacter harenae TaxID=2606218 RepID=A0A845M1F9_9RHOB|nr:WGR domain-containing protein [Maritimibacter harenae]
MVVCLQKVDPSRNQARFYVLEVSRTLFEEWTLTHRWGRIGSSGGQSLTVNYGSELEALAALARGKQAKIRRNYAEFA